MIRYIISWSFGTERARYVYLIVSENWSNVRKIEGDIRRRKFVFRICDFSAYKCFSFFCTHFLLIAFRSKGFRLEMFGSFWIFYMMFHKRDNWKKRSYARKICYWFCEWDWRTFNRNRNIYKSFYFRILIISTIKFYKYKYIFSIEQIRLYHAFEFENKYYIRNQYYLYRNNWK